MTLTIEEIELAKKALYEANVPVADRYVFSPEDGLMYYIDKDGNASVVEDEDE